MIIENLTNAKEEDVIALNVLSHLDICTQMRSGELRYSSKTIKKPTHEMFYGVLDELEEMGYVSFEFKRQSRKLTFSGRDTEQLQITESGKKFLRDYNKMIVELEAYNPMIIRNISELAQQIYLMGEVKIPIETCDEIVKNMFKEKNVNSLGISYD